LCGVLAIAAVVEIVVVVSAGPLAITRRAFLGRIEILTF
jgi:hypothetical protein